AHHVMTSGVDLNGRTALVTGGSRGIGAAAVRALHAAGASVFFTYLSGEQESAKLAAELGPRAAFARCDVGDRDSLAGLVDACVDKFGRLDILVNNAAVFSHNAFDGKDYARWREGWERTFAINVFACADLSFL